MFKADIIIPFCEADKHLVVDAITSIVQQTVPVLIHVVADNCEFPHIPFHKYIRLYKTPSQYGPSLIANSIAAHHAESDVIAIQDADDLSITTRIEKQLRILDAGFEQTSAPMVQEGMPNYVGDRHKKEPILYPGGTFGNVPLGRHINGTRTILLSTFIRVNGFCDLPCSGDLAFDNKTAYLGIAHSFSKEPLAIRRLHPDSMTNCPTFCRTQPGGKSVLARQIGMLHEIRESPTLEVARSQGCLDKAEPLCVVTYKEISA